MSSIKSMTYENPKTFLLLDTPPSGGWSMGREEREESVCIKVKKFSLFLYRSLTQQGFQRQKTLRQTRREVGESFEGFFPGARP